MARNKRARSSGSTTSVKTTNKQDADIESALDEEEEGNRRKRVRWDGAAPEPDKETDTRETEEDSEEDTRGDKTYLAAYCSGSRLACAYYDPVKRFVYVLEDTEENVHFDLTKMLFEQTSPDAIITSSRADDGFISVCQKYVDASGGTFQIRPHKDFTPSKGRNHLLSLGFLSSLEEEEGADGSDLGSVSDARSAYEFMKRRKDKYGDPTMRRWNASIRMSNFAAVDTAPLCVSCIGALLDQMARERAVGELDDEGVAGLEVLGIQALTLDAVMYINSDVLWSEYRYARHSSLQIFVDEGHASIHSDKTKEGLSLFAILDQTRTALGRRLLRTWLLRPSLDISIIASRHDAIDCFTRPENLVAANTMHNHLKGFRNIPKILTALRSGKAKTQDWLSLVKFTFHSAMLRDTLTELSMGRSVEVVHKLTAVLDIVSFKEVGTAVNETIDWEESTVSGRVCVRPHVDEELDNRKHVYHGLDAVLSKVAEDISETVSPDYASSLNVVYFPQLGYLICIPLLEEWKTGDGIVVMDGWTFQFSSESHVYFKSDKMHDLDTHIGDIYTSIVDREIEICQVLLDKILIFEQAISHACDVCAELDCLLCFAEASNAYGYTRPEMSEVNTIMIKQGRHPLQEQVVDTFVPNDAFLVGGAGIGSYPHVRGDEDDSSGEASLLGNSIVVCTGANACGKSVYLKQTALIQFMAQIGCFVPAESATLGIVDKSVFTRVKSRESVSRAQSALMIDLNQVSLALRNCTSRSLLLLDEFGKGTLSTDGAGLFCGVIKSLLARGADCPKVLATTHFHDLFRDDLLSPRLLPITYAHMEVLFTTTDGEVIIGSDHSDEAEQTGSLSRRIGHGEKITYLYRVAPGLSLRSQAARCAEIFGIPHDIVERAQYVSDLLSAHEITKLLDEDMTAAEMRELEEADRVCRRLLQWDLEVENKEEGDPRTGLAKILRELEEMEE